MTKKFVDKDQENAISEIFKKYNLSEILFIFCILLGSCDIGLIHKVLNYVFLYLEHLSDLKEAKSYREFVYNLLAFQGKLLDDNLVEQEPKLCEMLGDKGKSGRNLADLKSKAMCTMKTFRFQCR